MRVAAPLFAGTLALGLLACSPTASASPAAAPTSSAPTEPTIGASVPPTSPPAATGTAVAPACTKADVKASHGLVEGAAGSRLTTVVLIAATPCSVDAFPAMGLRDAMGTALVGAPAGGSGRLDLVAGGVYESKVSLANWCASDPEFPLTLEVEIGADEVAVTGGSFPDDGDMPPCNGGGGPILEAGAWEASP